MSARKLMDLDAAARRGDAAAAALAILCRIYMAHRCPGIVNGEAVLCPAYSDEARDALTAADVDLGGLA